MRSNCCEGFCTFLFVLVEVWCPLDDDGKERVGTVELPPAAEASVATKRARRAIPRPWGRKAGACDETKRDTGSGDEQSFSGSDGGSAADDEADPKPTPSPASSPGNRIRCVVKGVNGSPDREVWIDVGLD